jgi:hypothetical protein
MFVGCVSIRGADDYIALAVVGDCDVLVAAVCLDGESPSVVSVELGEWEVRCRAHWYGAIRWACSFN